MAGVSELEPIDYCISILKADGTCDVSLSGGCLQEAQVLSAQLKGERTVAWLNRPEVHQ